MAKKTTSLEKLDDLIQKYYGELSKVTAQNAKLEGLLKMIELRHKLAPSEADQREFWQMLENIRKEALSEVRSDSDDDASASRPVKDESEAG